MTTLQEAWDAALIYQWRRFGVMKNVFETFQVMTGKDAFNDASVRASLYRCPQGFIGLLWEVRSCVAEALPQLHRRLLVCAPEQDLDIARALGRSTLSWKKLTQHSHGDSELNAAQRSVRRNRQKIRLDVTKYSERNKATDWNTVKAGGGTPSNTSIRVSKDEKQ